MAIPRWLALPRPRRFLYVMSLRTGTEMITLSIIFNKISGFYGLLAILTGLSLNASQFSMYIYSIAALLLTAYLMPHIRLGSPFECLALAWFYAFDTLINGIYTFIFAFTWFLTVSANNSDGKVPAGVPGGSTIDDTAGFTNPKYNVSHVDVIDAAVGLGQDAVVLSSAGSGATSAASPSLGHGILLEESWASLIVIVLLTLLRVYFVLVVAAYARQVVRKSVFEGTGGRGMHVQVDGAGDASVPTIANATMEDPFAQTPGWKGKLGRMMVGVGRGYWLGESMEVDDAWARGMDGRFRNSKRSVVAAPPGTVERERRARSGTGPPMPPGGLPKKTPL